VIVIDAFSGLSEKLSTNFIDSSSNNLNFFQKKIEKPAKPFLSLFFLDGEAFGNCFLESCLDTLLMVLNLYGKGFRPGNHNAN